jgi:hypothetical protein
VPIDVAGQHPTTSVGDGFGGAAARDLAAAA